MAEVIREFMAAARETPGLFFAPFIGAWKELRRLALGLDAGTGCRDREQDQRPAQAQ